MWDGIGNWFDGFEPEGAVLVASDYASPIWAFAVGVLDVVMA